MAQYERHGLLLDSHELPDHLPLYLEYLAQLPEEEALGGLRDVAPILGLLSARLQQRESRYAVLFELLLKLANTQVDSQKVAEKIADEARDDTPQALDAVWEEEQVKFFADQGCGESEISAHQRRFAGAVAPQYLNTVSYTHLRAHETRHDLVCRLLLEKKKTKKEKIGSRESNK